jgi:hypothetical protein
LSVTADGSGVVAHAGSVGLRLLADRAGLTQALSTAMRRRSFVPVHDRGRVLADVAVMLADGGEAIADIDVLRHQADVLGLVTSPPTVWRALDEVTPARLRKIQAAPARGSAGTCGPSCRAGRRPRRSPAPASTLPWWCWTSTPPSWSPTARRRTRRRRSSTRSGSTRSGCGATAPVSSWPPGCGRATPARTPRATTSPS